MAASAQPQQEDEQETREQGQQQKAQDEVKVEQDVTPENGPVLTVETNSTAEASQPDQPEEEPTMPTSSIQVEQASEIAVRDEPNTDASSDLLATTKQDEPDTELTADGPVKSQECGQNSSTETANISVVSAGISDQREVKNTTGDNVAASPMRKAGAWAALLSLGSDLTQVQVTGNPSTIDAASAPSVKSPKVAKTEDTEGQSRHAESKAGPVRGTATGLGPPMQPPHAAQYTTMHPPHYSPEYAQMYPPHMAAHYPPYYFPPPGYPVPGYPTAVAPLPQSSPPRGAQYANPPMVPESPKPKRRKLPKSEANQNKTENGEDLPSDFWYWLPSEPGATDSSNLNIRPDRHGHIGDWDVLCGRGGESNNATGNKRYRRIVNERKAEYRKIPVKNRKQKTEFVRSIVDHVHSYGGRFIDLHEPSGRYYAVSIDRARKKTSQALRETKELKWLETPADSTNATVSVMAPPVVARPPISVPPSSSTVTTTTKRVPKSVAAPETATAPETGNPNFDFSLPGTRKPSTKPTTQEETKSCAYCGRLGHQTWKASVCTRHNEWVSSVASTAAKKKKEENDLMSTDVTTKAALSPGGGRSVDSGSPGLSVHCV